MSISAIISLKNAGISSLYIAPCHAAIFNPSVFSTFRDLYGVNVMTDSQNDLFRIRQNKSAQ